MARTSLVGLTAREKLNSMAVDSIHVIPDIVEDTYANGDLMAEGEIIPNAVVQDGGCGILQSVVGIDTTDSITTGVTLVITGDNADFGSVGSAPTAAPAAATAAATGDVSFSDLFAGEMGTKFLILTAVNLSNKILKCNRIIDQVHHTR